MHGDHVVFDVALGAKAFDDVAVAQANFRARREAEVAFGRGFLIIVALDPELAGEGE